MSVRKRRMHRLLAADASIDRSRHAYIYTPWRLDGRGQFLSDYSIHQFTISSEKTVGRASFPSDPCANKASSLRDNPLMHLTPIHL